MINLLNKSIYSSKQSIITLEDLVDHAVQNNYTDLGLCDDGLYGAKKFVDLCAKNNINPVVGVEFNFTDDISRRGSLGKLTLIIHNSNGYKKLCQLINRSYEEGNFNFRPRITVDNIRQIVSPNNGDLICVLGGVDNVIANLVGNNRNEYADFFIESFNEIFGRDYVRPAVVNLEEPSAKYRLYIDYVIDTNYFITSYSCFLKPKNYPTYDLLYCIDKKLKYKDNNRKHPNKEFYIKDQLSNSLKSYGLFDEDISKPINFLQHPLPTGKTFFPKPKIDNEHHEVYLWDLLLTKLCKLFKNKPPKEYVERLDYEFKAIKKLGFVDYFLVVKSITDIAHRENFRLGRARGSSAGSLVSYLCGITAVDPIKYGLLFERFLDPSGARVTMPDIDIDIDDSKRDRLIELIRTELYSPNQVTFIGNLNTLAFKSSIKDVGKALGIPYQTVNDYSKEIHFKITDRAGLLRDLRQKSKYKTDPVFKELIDFAEKLRGKCFRQLGTHAAGIIISPIPCEEIMPLQRDKKTGLPVTQFDKEDVEKIGLVKIDLLGLTALRTLDLTKKYIKDEYDINIDEDVIDYDDPEIFKTVYRGRTCGVFQIDGNKGMTEFAQRLHPENQKDISTLLALYRPAVLDSGLHELYFRNRSLPKERRRSIHPLVDDILEETYGISIFQESLMLMAQRLAGFSLSEGYTLLKGIGKKKIDVIESMKEAFVKGCAKNKIDKSDAENIFQIYENAARYSFNAAHSCAYSFNSCLGLFYKTYYPIEFICAAMNSEAKELTKLTRYIWECRRSNILVLPPMINISNYAFTIQKNVDGDRAIRYGLEAIKGLGKGFAKELFCLRHKQPNRKFESLKHLVDVLKNENILTQNKSKLDLVIRLGLLNDLDNTVNLLNELESFIKIDRRIKTENALFDIFDSDLVDSTQKTNTIDTNYDIRTLQREHMGVDFL